MTDDESQLLVKKYQQGDDYAASVLFNRYVARLTALAGARLSSKLRSKVDPEEVVQSAFRSFFKQVNAGRVEISERGKLWSLLAKITLRKIHRQAERYSAAKADVDREKEAVDYEGIPLEFVSDEPTPEVINSVKEILDNVLDGLKDVEREAIELHLQGYTEKEIADEVNKSTRTIRRLFAKLKTDLEQRLDVLQHDGA